MKVLVCGGRDYADRKAVDLHLEWLDAYTITHVIHGGASGADALAGAWARKTDGVQEVICPANWEIYGKRAGPLRNHGMLALRPDVVLAFPGGRGTAHMVSIAKMAGVKVNEVSE